MNQFLYNRAEHISKPTDAEEIIEIPVLPQSPEYAKWFESNARRFDMDELPPVVTKNNHGYTPLHYYRDFAGFWNDVTNKRDKYLEAMIKYDDDVYPVSWLPELEREKENAIIELGWLSRSFGTLFLSHPANAEVASKLYMSREHLHLLQYLTEILRATIKEYKSCSREVGKLSHDPEYLELRDAYKKQAEELIALLKADGEAIKQLGVVDNSNLVNDLAQYEAELA